jgi:membrane protease YdiL (CAAX protease family)
MRTERLQTFWPDLHGGLFLAAVVLVGFGLPSLLWPWYLLLPLVVYGCLAMLVPPLRRTVPRLSAGRADKFGMAAAVALAVLTSGVLLTYQVLAQPDLAALAARLPVGSIASPGGLVLAGLLFSFINATLEELIFRGVLYEAVAAERGVAVAVGVTALLFGLGHLQGYPPGASGAFLAGLYGVALGLLRWWSGGLGLCIACHVCADATIFGILAATGHLGG